MVGGVFFFLVMDECGWVVGVCVCFFFVGYRSQSDVACFFFSLGAVKKSSTRIHALV